MKLKPGHRYWEEDEKVSVVFDTDNNLERKYRYLLTCTWDETLSKVTFIMLNPSVADYTVCDPTLNRCCNFSKFWGYGGMKIVNLFALISTDPDELLIAKDPVGKENDMYILNAANDSAKIIFAWGEKHGSHYNRAKQVSYLLKDFTPYCIKKTKKGNHPRHPLYLKKDLMPIIF